MKNGPMKLAIAGPMASQLNTFLSCAGSCVARPAWRCTAITTMPEPPPVASAAKHSTAKVGNSMAAAQPRLAISMPMKNGRRSPWRSAKRPAGKARNTCVRANSASSTPTADAL
ncbi:hypothetical protein D3C86_1762290 [compost metagenome]